MATEPSRVTDPASPVRDIGNENDPEPGIGLCLSGGGYRAMVFHLGVLWRLNELGYLPRLERISSVSGGSITAAALGANWANLNFDAAGVATAFEDRVIEPVRALASRSIDARAIVGGALLPGTIADNVTASYDRHVFHGATLQDLPDRPRFVFNATNVQSGALWRFSKPYMADYRVGRVDRPEVSLAVAVAASSAFPPFLSPLELELPRGLVRPTEGADLHEEPYTTDVLLTDGGVYDNLGLETVWKNYRTVLVSDAGGKLQPDADPEHDWARHSKRVLDLIDNQVRSLRKRQLIEAYRRSERTGAYWGIRTNIADYPRTDVLPCPLDRTTDLANIPTRLKRLDAEVQERLINWGYAVCDAAMRSHVESGVRAPARFPYPDRGV